MDSPTETTSTPSASPTIFDEAHECLAQSLLMFLYADLRLLSATGRINTKYETLCIASDRVPRTSAAGLAQLPGMNEFIGGNSGDNSNDNNNNYMNNSDNIDGNNRIVQENEVESVSPAQIMAILIVELRQEVQTQRRRAREQIKRRTERGWFDILDDDESLDDDAGVMNILTGGRRDFETDMHAMVRAYNDMLRKDLRGIPEVSKFSNPFARENDGPSRTRQTIAAIKKFTDGIVPGRGGVTQEGEQQSKAKVPIRNAVSYDEYKYSRSSSERMHRKNDRGVNFISSKLENVQEKSETDFQLLEDLENDDATEIQPPPQDNEYPHRNKNITSSDSRGYQSKIYDFLESVKLKPPSSRDVETMSDPGVSQNGSSSPLHYSVETTDSAMQATPSRHRPTLSQQISVYLERAKEDHALHNKYLIPAEDYNTFHNAEDVGNVIFNATNMPSKRRLSTFDEASSTNDDATNGNSSKRISINSTNSEEKYMNETELLDFMTKCIDSRDDSKLSFMKDFFKEDSPSATMVKSHARIVWMNDWYTVKDLMYAISVDKQKKRVTVVFRGAITRPDWNHAFDGNLKKIQNPVKEDYEGKSNCIRVHRGFHTYLMRVRKDTGTRKYDEIANKAYEYGSRMIGDDFNVFINGYSLGGGLGVLFGFHASTDERLTRNGPIKIFTYGMPYIASHSFADAWRHQERRNKVQHARIYNSNDIVAYIPFNVRPSKRGSTFVHLGIDVKLYPVPKLCPCRSKPPRFHYNDRASPVASYWRALKMNALINMPWPWKIRNKHGLPELQMRLKKALVESEKSKNALLKKTLDEAYDDLVHQKEKR